MEAIMSLVRLCESLLRDGWNLDWSTLRFARGDEALAMLFALAILAAVAVVIRRKKANGPGRDGIVVPALPASIVSRSGRVWRSLPALLMLGGLIFVLIALADPYTTFVNREVNNPGRRILILLDASGSMGGGNFENRFKKTTATLKVRYAEPFYTAAAAAEYFVRLRMKSGYRDLIGLIEFGDESYIISPFSTDYENVLTSIRLLSDPEEYARFDNSGTKIAQAINQGVNLFKMFFFLKSAGNIMVLFSDGEDSQVEHEGRSLDDILAESSRHRIPIFFIRVASNKPFGHRSTNDALWSAAVEKTGGKLYAGANADVIVQACDEINKMAAGRIQYTRYSARTAQYPFFALSAMLCWGLGLALWLTCRFFRKFP